MWEYPWKSPEYCSPKVFEQKSSTTSSSKIIGLILTNTLLSLVICNFTVYIVVDRVDRSL